MNKSIRLTIALKNLFPEAARRLSARAKMVIVNAAEVSPRAVRSVQESVSATRMDIKAGTIIVEQPITNKVIDLMQIDTEYMASKVGMKGNRLGSEAIINRVATMETSQTVANKGDMGMLDQTSEYGMQWKL